MDDARLAALLEDAVRDVEPAERIAEIRSRLRPSRRRWAYAGGVLVAAAAAVAAVTVVGGRPLERAVDPAAPSNPTAAGTATTLTDDERGTAGLTPLLWVGDTPLGPRLFAEQTFLPLGYGQETLDAAVRAAVEGEPADPDYRNPWADRGRVVSVKEAGGAVEVRVDLVSDGSAPALGVEQVVAVVWAVQGRRLPVTVDVRTEGPRRPVTVTTREDLAVLAPVQLEVPAEGAEVSGSFTARGLASSYEATVPWLLEDASGRVVRDGFATAEGWMDRLYPWETEVDVSGLAPGTYTFVASTSDPSGGTEGPGPTTDTRTVVVQ